MFTINPMESYLKKTIIGNCFILRQSNFKKLLQAIKIYKYKETFNIGDKYRGEFICDVSGQQFKNERLLEYNGKLKINRLFSNEPFLIETLQLKPTTFRIRDPPHFFHRIHLDNKIAGIDDIPKDLYYHLMNKSNKDIINFTAN
jgi:hypothetical protein